MSREEVWIGMGWFQCSFPVGSQKLEATLRKYKDPDTAQPYYHNAKTGETTWQLCSLKQEEEKKAQK